MSREEWVKQFSQKAPILSEEVLTRCLGQFGVKIKK